MTFPSPPEWRHVVCPGRIDEDGHRMPVFVEIEYHFQRNQKYELSFTGVTGPTTNGNAYGSCGQNRDDLNHLTRLNRGWTPTMVARLAEMWERWHLNGMQAGSPAQREFLRQHEWPGYPINHYVWAQALLSRAGLHPDPNHDDYEYGSAWLYEELPDELLDEIWTFPTAHINHPWNVYEKPRKEVTDA